VIVGTVGSLARLTFRFSKVNVHNNAVFMEKVMNRPPKESLLTICNHISTIDDPGVWGMLFDYKFFWFQTHLLRWSLGAKELMFTNPLFNYFFGSGRVIPIVRGAGLNQEGVNKAIEMLNKGEWVHMFPEGKVIETGTLLPRLKWGIGKLVHSTTETTPCMIPMYLSGLEKIMPPKKKYWIPRAYGKTVDVLFGEPVYFKELLNKHREKGSSPSEIYIDITNLAAAELKKLELACKNMHQQRQQQQQQHHQG